MGKEFWKEFYQWLDNARQGELLAWRDYLKEIQPGLSSEVRADCKRMIRLVDQELITRFEVVKFDRRQSAA